MVYDSTAMTALSGARVAVFGTTATAETAPVAFVDLPEMLVNLSAPSNRPQYLRLKIALEVADAHVAEEIKPVLPRVVDAFQMHLRELRPDDLTGSAALYRLKEELRRRVDDFNVLGQL